MLCCLIYCCIKQQRRQGTGAAGPAGPVTEVELTISGTDGMDCGCVDFPYSRVPPVLAHLFSQEEWERDVFTPLKNSLEYQNACCTCPCVIFFPLHLATLGLTAFPAHLMVTVSNRDVDTAVRQVCQDLSRRFSDRVGFGLHVSLQPAPQSKYCRAIVVYIKTEEQVAREAAAMEGMEMAAAKQAAARPQQGDTVWHDGQQCTVQYVNSKGLLDLRNTGGAVFYGVAAAGTTSSRRAMPPPGTE